MQLSGDVLAAYLSIYGGVEQVTQVTSTRGTAYGDYVFVMCLDRGGFNNIPHKIKYRDTTMTVIVEGRKPLCWSCNKIGHFSKNCPQKMTTTTTTTTTTTNVTTPSPVITITAPIETSENNKDNLNKKVNEGWTQVTKKKKGKKTPMKKPSATENKVNSSNDPTTVTNISTATTSTSTISTKQSSSASTTATKQSMTTIEPMDMSINLKRRRDSEDSPTKEGEKKHPKNQHKKQPPCLNLWGKNNSSPKSTTCTIDPTPTKTKNYPSHSNWNTNTPLSFTNYNPKNTYKVTFGDQTFTLSTNTVNINSINIINNT